MKTLLFTLIALLAMPVCAEQESQNLKSESSQDEPWLIYSPEKSTGHNKRGASIASIRLTSLQEDFDLTTEAQDIAKLASYTKDLLTSQVGGSNEKGEILLKVTIRKGEKPEFKISYQGLIMEDTLRRFYNGLDFIHIASREKATSVTIEIYLVINNA